MQEVVVGCRVSIWVVWNAINAIKDVELLFKDGGSLSLGRIPVYCDMPFTAELKLVSVVNKVRDILLKLLRKYTKFISVPFF